MLRLQTQAAARSGQNGYAQSGRGNGPQDRLAQRHNGCARREDIIDEQYMLILQRLAIPHAKDSLDVIPTVGVALRGLAGVVAMAAKAVAIDLEPHLAGHTFGQILRLIISALSFSFFMKRHRYQYINSPCFQKRSM